MLNDDSYRTGTSSSPICECGSDRETAAHFLLHCTMYQQIRNNTLESALDILKCSKNSSMLDNFELLLLVPAIDCVTTSQNNTIKELLFEFLSDSKRKLWIYLHHSHFYLYDINWWFIHWNLHTCLHTFCITIVRLQREDCTQLFSPVVSTWMTPGAL